MLTATSTPTEAAPARGRALVPAATRTELVVTRSPSGGRVSVVHRCEGGPHRPVIRPILISSDTHGARVSLVPEGALLLADDAVELDINVGPGVTLVLSEPAGTVAYDMRGGSASWHVRVHVAAKGRLNWHGEPFVVAAGADVHRHTRVVLGRGARLALRETLVLGRHGEAGGVLDQRMDVVTEDGWPLLVDALDTSGPRLSWGDQRVLSSVALIGACLPDEIPLQPPATRFDLDRPGTLVRALSDAAHRADLTGAWRAATALADV